MILSKNKKELLAFLLLFCFILFAAFPFSRQFAGNSVEIGQSARFTLIGFILNNLDSPGPLENSTHPDFGLLIRKGRAILSEDAVKRTIPVFKSVISGLLSYAPDFFRIQRMSSAESCRFREYLSFSSSGVSPPL